MKTIVQFWFVLGALSATGTVIITKSGEKAMITCGEGSFSNKLLWYHRGNFIVENNVRGFPRKGTVDITKRFNLKKETDLEILGVKEEDAGQFTCVVDGTSHEHTLLVVSVWASPSGDLLLGSEATLQCQVKGLDQGSTVQWKRPDGSAYGESHTAQLRPVDRSYAGTWKCMFSFGGKEYSESLHISVKEPAPTTSEPVTSKGSKDICNPTCPNCTTPSAAQLLGLNWLLWVTVGVVVLLVCVIVLCKRIRRRKSVMDQASMSCLHSSVTWGRARCAATTSVTSRRISSKCLLVFPADRTVM
ncbi:T-cell surface glycoprotein CD4-like [Micropterus salmoides]|uniref:T-cell surface glycoprotein CD4-like n=1 Tax=Micropterus salmoides TaxID=27706 RepID=UPI0018ED7500|nr:T-cell surface glycoprotein CD4-like [Micropterus salmoides]